MLAGGPRLTDHFILDEFRCSCCGAVNAEHALAVAKALEPVRADVGPIRLVSAFRCPHQNELVGGRPLSFHLTGLAVDIHCDTDRDRFDLVTSLLKHGFRRLGIKDTYIHADLGPAPVDVLWTYYH